jgi:hypothetical protein
LTPQLVTLANELELTRENSKQEITDALVGEFYRVFAGFPVELLHSAFRVWRSRSPHFPAISDIYSIIRQLREEQRIEQQIAKDRRDQDELEAARKDWDRYCEENAIPIGTSQRDWVMKQAIKKVKVVPSLLRGRAAK